MCRLAQVQYKLHQSVRLNNTVSGMGLIRLQSFHVTTLQRIQRTCVCILLATHASSLIGISYQYDWSVLRSHNVMYHATRNMSTRTCAVHKVSILYACVEHGWGKTQANIKSCHMIFDRRIN